MHRQEVLHATRSTWAGAADHLARLLLDRPELDIPLGGGSQWTGREAVIHLAIGADVYGEIAAGLPSPVTVIDKQTLGELSRGLIAQVTETDTGKLVELLRGSVDGFLARTADWPSAWPVVWHCGLTRDLADLTGVLLGEMLLHGHDIAAALHAPWSIQPQDALFALGAAGPMLGLLVNPTTAAGHSAGYRITLRGGPELALRFVDGVLSPAASPDRVVDCKISTEPVALLLVLAGRMPVRHAITGGLLTGGGARPELAAGFPDLFVYP